MSLTWQEPGFAYLLAAVPLALLLALLSRREKRRRVPSLLPWQAVLALPRPRPRRNPIDLETVCAVLVPLLAVAALAQPVLTARSAPSDHVVVMVDTSTSMGSASSQTPSRQKQALEWLQRLSREKGRKAFTVYGTHAFVPLVTRAPVQDAVMAVRRVKLTPQSPEQHEGLLTAVLAATDRDSAPLVWISDRPAPGASPRLREILVGQASQNIGLVLARIMSDPNGSRAFAAVRNFSDAPRSGTLTAALENTEPSPPPQKPFTIQPGETASLFIPLPEGAGPVVDLTLATDKDDLAADNSARVFAPEYRRAAIDSSRFPHAALALKLSAGCSVLPVAKASQADLAVVSDPPLLDKDLPRVGILLLTPASAHCGLVHVGPKQKVRNPRVLEIPQPLPEIAVSGLNLAEVREVVLPEGALTLAEGTVGEKTLPLIATWTWKGRRVAYLGALPQNWTAQPAFPVLMAELVDRLLPPGKVLPGLQESDNRLLAPATTECPALAAAGPAPRPVPLSRWCALLAGACAVTLFVREATRSRRALQLRASREK